MSSDKPAFTFADLFAGIGGFHAVLKHAGGRAVFVSEIDREARATYERNWVNTLPEDEPRPVMNEDINTATPDTGLVGVPEQIDLLTAGFPCQAFSKSGKQKGFTDETRGTLFFNICRILEERHPSVILLENVRNLVGPRHAHEWEVIVRRLRDIGYRVSSTPSVFSPHFLPPELGGTPQVRDRVFILGTYVGTERAHAEADVPPTLVRGPVAGWDPNSWEIDWVLDDDRDIRGLSRYVLSDAERKWINAWDDLVQRLRKARGGERLPGFPLWADEWRTLGQLAATHDLGSLPTWKADFLTKNARFYEEHRSVIDSWRADWPQFETFPPSRRKLEWQAQDTESLWDTAMHFRPSGIRCKRPTYVPALVAITQTTIVGPRGRRLTEHEAIRLQGMPPEFSFGLQRSAASYKQAGNGVSVGAAFYALRTHVERDRDDIPQHIVDAILEAPRNPSTGAVRIPAPSLSVRSPVCA